MAALSFSPPPSGPPSKRLRIGSSRGCRAARRGRRRDRGGGQRDAARVEQHAQLRRGDEIVARRGNERRVEPDALQPLAQVVVLDLRLQIEDPQAGAAA